MASHASSTWEHWHLVLQGESCLKIGTLCSKGLDFIRAKAMAHLTSQILYLGARYLRMCQCNCKAESRSWAVTSRSLHPDAATWSVRLGFTLGVAPSHAILILALSYRQHDTQHAEVLQRALRPLDTRAYGKAYLHVQECWRLAPLILQRLVHMLSASVLSVRGRPV